MRLALVALLLVCGVGPIAGAAESKPDGKKAAEAAKDPLAKFSEDDLVRIDFCFEKFVEAIGANDARTAAAFIDTLPRELASLDLNKDADKTKLLAALAKYQGASIVSSLKMPAGGMGEITYTDKSGAQKTVRMQKAGPRWKVVLD